jgi:addiction module HigA family antidote
MLKLEFLEPMGISQMQFAHHLGWPYARLNEIINERRGVSADSALAFAEALKTTPEFWLNLQIAWALWHAQKNHVQIPALKKAS